MSKLTHLLKILVIFCIGLFIFGFFGYTDQKRPMTFVDVVSLKRVYGPSLSPDGEKILITISEADWKNNKQVSHVWRINSDGSDLVQMTNSKDGESGGIWSLDGKYISFITKRNEESQIFLMRTDGGEALEFTRHKGGVEYHRWSPDSQAIYFLASDPLSDEEEKKKKKKDDAFLFEKNYKHRHLWSIDVKTKEEKRLTEGEFTVSSFTLSQDGTKIVYRAAPTPLYDDFLNAEIWLMDLTNGSSRQITHNKISEGNISISPDNSQILFTSDANADLESYYQSKIFLVSVEGGTPEVLLPDFPYEVWQAVWAADGKKIYLTANTGVRSEIFAVTLTGRHVTQLTKGDHAIYGFEYSQNTDSMAYLVDSPHNPGVLWKAGMTPFSPQKVFDPYPELERFMLADYEVIQWTSSDGKSVEGILIYPIGYEKGNRYPLLVHTHGGPMASDKMTFDGYTQAKAGRGYAILKPNYRGSTGYGDEVLRDMVGHYFLHADDDVLTGVDYLVEKGIADAERMGTLGWSAGGHMTNWIVTQTNRFKAASSGAGASNWISMYAQSDVRIYRTPWFLGTPWEENAPLEAYREHSPIFYVHKAKTPTLILFGENDHRVPLPQGVEMYRGLKANGVPAELVIFPRAGHGPTELLHQLYKMNKEFQWLEKYIMGREFEFEKAPEDVKTKNEALPKG